MENEKGRFSRFIKDPALYDNLNASSKRLAAILDSVAKGRGTLGRLIADKSLYENLDSSSKKLSAVLDRLEKGEGALGGLTMKNGQTTREMEQTINALQSLIEDIKKHPKKYLKISIF